MLLTGAFHEDGLADTSDALGGAYDREKVLAILKDSRIGTFGAVALVISIVGRACLVAELSARALIGLVVVGSVARVAPIWLMAALPYVTDDKAAKSRGILQGGYIQAAVATLWASVLLVGLFVARELTISSIGTLVAAMILVGAITGWRYRRRVGSVTGDFLGATEQLGEIAALVVLVASRGRPWPSGKIMMKPGRAGEAHRRGLLLQRIQELSHDVALFRAVRLRDEPVDELRLLELIVVATSMRAHEVQVARDAAGNDIARDAFDVYECLLEASGVVPDAGRDEKVFAGGETDQEAALGVRIGRSRLANIRRDELFELFGRAFGYAERTVGRRVFRQAVVRITRTRRRCGRDGCRSLRWSLRAAAAPRDGE